VAESSHTVIAVNVLGQNTKHEMMYDQKYKVKISGPEVECKLTDTFQGTFHEKVLRIPGCVVNSVADLDFRRDSWRGKMSLFRQMGKELGRGCYDWLVENIKFGSRAKSLDELYKIGWGFGRTRKGVMERQDDTSNLSMQ
jgi:hypothetical protein